jgi:hypothetical protein
MEDKLDIIKQVNKWHKTIRGHIKLVGDSISDQEALITLLITRADWLPEQLEDLEEKRVNLQQTISYLDEGLRNHFEFEEKALPSVLGELFFQALNLEHQEIIGTIDKAKLLVADTHFKGVNRDVLTNRAAEMKDVIDDIGKMIEEHAVKEEVLLGMLKRTLQQKNKQSGKDKDKSSESYLDYD